MSIFSHRRLAVPLLLLAPLHMVRAQRAPVPAIAVAGVGPETIVLISGMVGGVAGFQRLATLLVAEGNRVVVIDPYRLSLDSADVTFAAMARRVDAILGARGVMHARVIAHSQGAGVALRLAAMSPDRVAALYFLDAGAQAVNRGPTLSSAIRLVPVLTRMPGGRRLVRGRFVSALRASSGHQEWLDSATVTAYADPMLDGIDRVVAMACRLARAEEAEPLAAVMSRIHVPVTVLIGDAPHETGAGREEIAALETLGPLLRTEHLRGVGHFIHEEAPNDVIQLLRDAHAGIAGRRDGREGGVEGFEE